MHRVAQTRALFYVPLQFTRGSPPMSPGSTPQEAGVRNHSSPPPHQGHLVDLGTPITGQTELVGVLREVRVGERQLGA